MEYRDGDLHHTLPGEESIVSGVIMHSEGGDRGVDKVKGTQYSAPIQNIKDKK